MTRQPVRMLFGIAVVSALAVMTAATFAALTPKPVAVVSARDIAIAKLDIVRSPRDDERCRSFRRPLHCSRVTVQPFHRNHRCHACAERLLRDARLS